MKTNDETSVRYRRNVGDTEYKMDGKQGVATVSTITKCRH